MLTPGSPLGSSRNIIPTPLATGPSSTSAAPGLHSSPSGKSMAQQQRPGTKPCENCGVRLTAHSMGIHKEVCNKPFAPSISSVATPTAASTPASPIAVPQRRVSPGRRTSTPGNPNTNGRTHTPLDSTPRQQATTHRREEPLPSRTSTPATNKPFQEAPRLPTVSDTRVNEISDGMANLQRQMLEQQERHKREMFALKKEMESIKRSVSAEDRDFYQASQENMKLISKLSSKIDSLAVDVQEVQASHAALKKEVRQISKTPTTQGGGSSQQPSFVGTPSKATNHRNDSQWISHHQHQQSSSRVTVEQDSRIDNLNSQLTTVQRDLQQLLKMSKNTQQQQPQQQQQFSPDPHTHSRHNNVSTRYDDNVQLLNFAKEEFTDITRTAPTAKQQGGGGALTPRHPDFSAAGGSTPHQHHPVKRQSGNETSRVYREESMADDTVRRVVTAVQSQPLRSRTTAAHHARNVAPQYPVDRTPQHQHHSGIYNDSRRVAFKRSPSRSSPPRPGEWRLDHRSASL